MKVVMMIGQHLRQGALEEAPLVERRLPDEGLEERLVAQGMPYGVGR
jgi:hypothetical protein